MIAFFVGFFAFLLAGFGLGGGVLLIPALTNIFSIEQSLAQYISLIAYLPAAISIIIISFKENRINFKKIFSLIPTGLFGAIVGAIITQNINVSFLKKMYGIFAIFVGINMFLGVLKKRKLRKESNFNQNI